MVVRFEGRSAGGKYRIRLALMLVIFVTAATARAEECDLLLKSSDLKPLEVNGEILMVADPQKVRESLAVTGCAEIAAELERLKTALAQRDQLLQQYQQLVADYDGQIGRHQQTLEKTQQLNDQYSQLTNDYNLQIDRYETVTRDMSQLSHELDDLAEEYRDLAVDMMSRYRLGAAVGGGSEGLASQLQLGYDHLNLFLNNYNDRTSAMVGAEIRF